MDLWSHKQEPYLLDDWFAAIWQSFTVPTIQDNQHSFQNDFPPFLHKVNPVVWNQPHITNSKVSWLETGLRWVMTTIGGWEQWWQWGDDNQESTPRQLSSGWPNTYHHPDVNPRCPPLVITGSAEGKGSGSRCVSRARKSGYLSSSQFYFWRQNRSQHLPLLLHKFLHLDTFQLHFSFPVVIKNVEVRLFVHGGVYLCQFFLWFVVYFILVAAQEGQVALDIAICPAAPGSLQADSVVHCDVHTSSVFFLSATQNSSVQTTNARTVLETHHFGQRLFYKHQKNSEQESFIWHLAIWRLSGVGKIDSTRHPENWTVVMRKSSLHQVFFVLSMGELSLPFKSMFASINTKCAENPTFDSTHCVPFLFWEHWIPPTPVTIQIKTNERVFFFSPLEAIDPLLHAISQQLHCASQPRHIDSFRALQTRVGLLRGVCCAYSSMAGAPGGEAVHSPLSNSHHCVWYCAESKPISGALSIKTANVHSTWTTAVASSDTISWSITNRSKHLAVKTDEASRLQYLLICSLRTVNCFRTKYKPAGHPFTFERWAGLGANKLQGNQKVSCTSALRNSYREVKVWCPDSPCSQMRSFCINPQWVTREQKETCLFFTTEIETINQNCLLWASRMNCFIFLGVFGNFVSHTVSQKRTVLFVLFFWCRRFTQR